MGLLIGAWAARIERHSSEQGDYSFTSAMSLKAKMDRMDPILRSGGGGGGGSILSNMNVARMVQNAFRPNKNAVGPRMLGVKKKPALTRTVSAIELEATGIPQTKLV